MASFEKIVDDRGWDLLHVEAHSGNLNELRWLLDNVVDVNTAV